MVSASGVVDLLVGWPGLLVLVLVVVALSLLYRSLVVVDAHEKYVVSGADPRVIEPGFTFVSPLSGGRHVDLRERQFTQSLEDITTADDVGVTVAVRVTVRVTDPVLAVTEADAPDAAPADLPDHLAVAREQTIQAALDEVGRRTFDSLVEDPDDLAADCRRTVAPALSAVGVTVEEFAVTAVERSRPEEGAAASTDPAATE